VRANRPTSISHPGGTDTFSWNALGQRMRATFWGPGCVRRYFYDGQRVLEETNDAGGIYARYIAEGSSYYDPLLLFARCSGEVRYPLYDGIGTTQRLVDQNGTVTDSYTLDAFGKPFSSTGSTRNPYRYGGAWDYFTDYLGSGLLQLGHRFYWPEVGRFIQQDPEGEGVNWYAYVGNNPTSYVDPVGGLAQFVAPLLAGAGGGAFVEGEGIAVLCGPPGWIVGGVAAIGLGAYLLTRPTPAPLAGPTICPAKGGNPGSGYGKQNDPRGKPRYKGPPRSNRPDVPHSPPNPRVPPNVTNPGGPRPDGGPFIPAPPPGGIWHRVGQFIRRALGLG